MQPADLRVLVIEDESDSALLMGSTLMYGGIQSWTASTGEQALEMMKEVNPNLLLVDLALPGMDGWEFLKQVRANPTTARVLAVVISAYLTPAVAQQALKAGFRACFMKPVDTTSLVRQLLTLFD